MLVMLNIEGNLREFWEEGRMGIGSNGIVVGNIKGEKWVSRI